jgi:[acyl-carrier-protein] S-malonyltransferase
MADQGIVILCPGQGAQAVGMGRAWAEASAAARVVFDEADRILGDSLGMPLSELCFGGPAERLNQTDASQPAIFVCSVASLRGLAERGEALVEHASAAAGLSLGEYTALHLAGSLSFEDGLRLVALRGRVMQEACDEQPGGMVALVGADPDQARAVCETAGQDQVLVPANFNAPGQIVLSGHSEACARAVQAAADVGLRASPLKVAGAFHSPLMQSAARKMADALAAAELRPLAFDVWSNVTARPHEAGNAELLRQRLVEQIVSPVQWSQTCIGLVAAGDHAFHELAPGSVLKGLMRRIERQARVLSHDEP